MYYIKNCIFFVSEKSISRSKTYINQIKKIKSMKTERKNNLKSVGLVLGTIAMSTLSSSAFTVTPLGSAGEIRSEVLNSNFVHNALADAKCGEKGKTSESKCGEGKSKEAKCGEGKAKEAKCGEGKCGEEGKSKEAKCGEGKCGEEGKSKEAKCGEGKAKEAKCGEGKCGEK